MLCLQQICLIVVSLFHFYFIIAAGTSRYTIEDSSVYDWPGHSLIFCRDSLVQKVVELALSYSDDVRPLNKIPISLYKTVAPQSANYFRVFRCLCEKLCFPAAFRLSKAVPKFGFGDNTNPKKWRPISMLNLIAKLFENLNYQRWLFSFIAKNIAL